ncbi:TlpA family protein disulfide reductase [Sphingobacterium tabacisoli]|uniref:TlpA family protein disulfide reductase n=1 Tax=Sphingobacterium tabacisoli TaxID=2044855 RepID=A0ABW5L1K1_9SPHI|nr:hypothetical protein [Sphingobacterium tabacisoli]
MKKNILGRCFFSPLCNALFILSLLLLNCIWSTAIGQENGKTPFKETTGIFNISSIGVNDYLPDNFWDQQVKLYVKGDTSSVPLEKFRGKAIIIDFWSNDCASCITKFPKLFAFQQKFEPYFNVLLVNKAGSEHIHRLRNDFLRNHDLSTVFKDEYLNALFPHKGVPHYVWITPIGRVAAITSAEFADEMRVKAFVDSCVKYEMPHLRTRGVNK